MAAPLRKGLRISKTIHCSGYCRLVLSRKKSESVKGYRKEEKYQTEPSQTSEYDWIGPADKVSNIRKYQYFIPENESKEEQQFRLKREETQEWHHQFWTTHNKNFFMMKDEFVKNKLKEKQKQSADGDNPDDDKTITPEEMSEFYRKFLDENYNLHKEYNKQWYKTNISLLWPALKLQIKRTFSSKRTNS